MDFKNVMLKEIMAQLKEQLNNSEFQYLRNKKFHLGIFTEPCLTDMLNGKKTIESRFSKKKSAPFGKIKKDDIVIVKKSSGNVVAYFTIKEVLSFDLAQYKIEDIKKQYEKELCVSEQFWLEKNDSKFATLLMIDKMILLKPFPITKKGMQTWIVLNKEEN